MQQFRVRSREVRIRTVVCRDAEPAQRRFTPASVSADMIVSTYERGKGSVTGPRGG